MLRNVKFLARTHAHAHARTHERGGELLLIQSRGGKCPNVWQFDFEGESGLKRGRFFPLFFPL